MKTSKTKKRFLLSLVAVIACVAMLVGTTMAWFTDSVTSGKNRIVAGNLDVELLHSNAAVTDESVQGATDLFKVKKNDDGSYEELLWEPGVIAYENFTVKNVGNLALKYALNLNVYDKNALDSHDLTEVIKVAVVENGFSGSRDDAKAITGFQTLADFQETGELAANDTTGNTFGVVLYWEPTDSDNLYNVNNGQTVATSDNGVTATDANNALFVEFGVNLVATQDTVEVDSFDRYYDQGVAITTVTNGKVPEITIDATPDVDSDKSTTINFEEGAFTENGTLEITLDVKDVPPASHFSIKEDAGTVASIDLNAVFKGTNVSQFNGKKVTVTTYIAKGLDESKLNVVYTGDEAQPTVILYESTTGKLVFSTTHFSEYLVTEDTVVAYDIATKKFYKDLSGVAFTQNSDVIILKNLNLTGTGVTFNSNTTSKLDLNGYVITGIYDVQGTSALITNEGTLTICDNTDTSKNGTGGGKITTNASKTDLQPVPGYASNAITNHGTLTVESGYINNVSSAGTAAFAIDNTNNAKLIVNGGKIEADSSAAIRQWAIGGTNNTVTITNGSIISHGAHGMWLQDGEANTAGSLTITGGYFEGCKNGIQVGHEGKSKNYSISISNCTVKGNLVFVYTDYKKMDVDEKTVNIIGGVLAKGVTSPYIAKNEASSKDGYLPDGLLGVDYEYDFGVDLTNYNIVMAYDCWTSPNPETIIDPSLYHTDGSKLFIDGAAMKESAENYFGIWITAK